MFFNLFKFGSKQENTQVISENSVSIELNSLLSNLTISSSRKQKISKDEVSVKEKTSTVVSSLEKQIEENQIIYAKIMQERMMRTRRKLV
ncbi:hypothetical protein [Maribacter huludaoensis]|uniref:hypothetical protein n=1 Tax=Maribacter huludaoensis TaxID=3030010 RepID=UPI0023EAD396|nr:hypothetical protein [Maribacter huludaoensis]MDF4221153.1 hypothetical protein [Maribacter huludaoensis]